MGKRKKKKQKKLFPWLIEQENLFIPKTGNEIVTDAGWDKIAFDDAPKFFTRQTIQDWYESFLAELDIFQLVQESTINVDLEDEQAVDEFLANYNHTPQELSLVVAKAVYQHYAWVRVLLISTPDVEEHYFQNHEMEAIRLGIHLRNYLNEEIPVINDCLDAVRYFYGRYPNINWQPRKYVSAAYKLKISQATQIYNEQAWEQEWDED
jgi:hypothetical protein